MPDPERPTTAEGGGSDGLDGVWVGLRQALPPCGCLRPPCVRLEADIVIQPILIYLHQERQPPKDNPYPDASPPHHSQPQS